MSTQISFGKSTGVASCLLSAKWKRKLSNTSCETPNLHLPALGKTLFPCQGKLHCKGARCLQLTVRLSPCPPYYGTSQGQWERHVSEIQVPSLSNAVQSYRPVITPRIKEAKSDLGLHSSPCKNRPLSNKWHPGDASLM